jgi:Xaa-Pro aminopeptidase
MLETELLKDLQRRQKEILEFLDGRLLIVASAYEKVRNNDVYHPFRQDSQFHYLTSFPEPDSVAVFDPQDERDNYTLFVRERDKFKELWQGFRYGVDDAARIFQADKAFPLTKLEDILGKKIFDRDVVLWVEDGHPCEDSLLMLTEGNCSESDDYELLEKLGEMRAVKSDWEISCLRQASRISTEAHHALMKRSLLSTHEYNLHAEFTYYCHNQGASSMAYPPIVASGTNATCLHYGANNKVIDRQGLVLVDAGCEINGYAADITRTFPASGTFNPLQKECYEMVLRAQKEALKTIAPNNSLGNVHNTAVAVLTEGMIELGLLSTSLDEAIEKKLYADFYPHGTGHWLGLDVHDCGPDKFTGFRERMAFTIEPGFYVQEYNDKVPEEFKGIGIRIEDNVVITANSCENLTSNCVKEVNEIEAMVLN